MMRIRLNNNNLKKKNVEDSEDFLANSNNPSDVVRETFWYRVNLIGAFTVHAEA